MRYLDNINVTYYPGNIKTTKPLGSIDLRYIINSIKEPRPEIKSIFFAIEKSEASGDMKTKAILKQNNLYYFTPCIQIGQGVEKTNAKGKKYISYRCYENIVGFNGLLVLDFDHINNAEEFKRFVFFKFPEVITAFLSPSRKGVKFLIRIPEVHNVDDFKSYFYGLGSELDKYKGWDSSCQNPVLPLFYSWDPYILHRENPEVWTKKGLKLTEDFSESVPLNIEIQTTDKDKSIILNNCKKAFEAIFDNGHPQLRAACISLGGYVASGYLTEDEAVSFVHDIIPAHQYLKKGINGYKKTAVEGIKKGQLKPLTL